MPPTGRGKLIDALHNYICAHILPNTVCISVGVIICPIWIEKIQSLNLSFLFENIFLKSTSLHPYSVWHLITSPLNQGEPPLKVRLNYRLAFPLQTVLLIGWLSSFSGKSSRNPLCSISFSSLTVCIIVYIAEAWWRHQVETFFALLAICAGIHRSPVNFPHKGQWREALMFSLICAWINGWVNNRGADDLRRHRAYYDIIVMDTYFVFYRLQQQILWWILHAINYISCKNSYFQ